ncbi:hypothetical protein FPQ18DRAFT_124595 [Pyronema domesticum]|nr:hypothetical protein FPQ18DRAFT_124595 [Pyronema domesticum]
MIILSSHLNHLECGRFSFFFLWLSDVGVYYSMLRCLGLNFSDFRFQILRLHGVCWGVITFGFLSLRRGYIAWGLFGWHHYICFMVRFSFMAGIVLGLQGAWSDGMIFRRRRLFLLDTRCLLTVFIILSLYLYLIWFCCTIFFFFLFCFLCKVLYWLFVLYILLF